MFCPRCGSQQTTDEIRFCVKCGLQLGNAKSLLSNDVTDFRLERQSGLSPRAKGVLQGVAIIPVSVGLLFMLDIFYEAVFGLGIMGGVFAMLTLIVAVAVWRISYALLREEGRSKSHTHPPDIQDSEPNLFSPNTKSLADKPIDIVVSAIGSEPPSVTDKTTQKLRVNR